MMRRSTVLAAALVAAGGTLVGTVALTGSGPARATGGEWAGTSVVFDGDWPQVRSLPALAFEPAADVSLERLSMYVPASPELGLGETELRLSREGGHAYLVSGRWDPPSEFSPEPLPGHEANVAAEQFAAHIYSAASSSVPLGVSTGPPSEYLRDGEGSDDPQVLGSQVRVAPTVAAGGTDLRLSGWEGSVVITEERWPVEFTVPAAGFVSDGEVDGDTALELDDIVAAIADGAVDAGRSTAPPNSTVWEVSSASLHGFPGLGGEVVWLWRLGDDTHEVWVPAVGEG